MAVDLKHSRELFTGKPESPFVWWETTRNENKKLSGSRNKETQCGPSSACWKWKETIV